MRTERDDSSVSYQDMGINRGGRISAVCKNGVNPVWYLLHSESASGHMCFVLLSVRCDHILPGTWERGEQGRRRQKKTKKQNGVSCRGHCVHCLSKSLWSAALHFFKGLASATDAKLATLVPTGSLGMSERGRQTDRETGIKGKTERRSQVSRLAKGHWCV